MTSITINFKNLVPCKGLEICVLLLIVVISSGFSSSTPIEHEHGGFVLKTEHDRGLDNMSCLEENANHLFDLETKKCYIAGLRGPCNRNMRFSRTILDIKNQDQKLDRIGECDCNPHAVIPLVYHIETDQCYPLFHQSYCPKDQWLLYLEIEKGPVCKPNPCLREQLLNPHKIIVLFYGQCVALEASCNPPAPSNSSSGLRTLSSKITSQFIVHFQEYDVFPTCSYPELDINYALGSMGVQSCRTGFKKDVQGRCRKTSNKNLNSRSSAPKSTTNNKDDIIFGDEDTTDSTES